MGVLTPQQVEAFIERGFCVLEGAFDARQAAAAREVVWERMAAKRAILREDPSTWPEAYDIEEHLRAPAVLECFTDRLVAGIEALVGPGRWVGDRRWGFWPVNFRFGATAPEPFPRFGWHIDGNYFRHTVDCPRQGLLLVGLFSDVAPGWGGTIVAEGSHQHTARVLARHPEGLEHRALFEEVLREPLGNFHELTGAAGDVVLAHPFLFHTRGFKRAGPPRFISNTEASLRAPMILNRPDPRDDSVLERSIRRALAAAPLRLEGAVSCRF